MEPCEKYQQDTASILEPMVHFEEQANKNQKVSVELDGKVHKFKLE